MSRDLREIVIQSVPLTDVGMLIEDDNEGGHVGWPPDAEDVD